MHPGAFHTRKSVAESGRLPTWLLADRYRISAKRNHRAWHLECLVSMIMVVNKEKRMQMSGQCDVKLNSMRHKECERDERIIKCTSLTTLVLRSSDLALDASTVPRSESQTQLAV